MTTKTMIAVLALLVAGCGTKTVYDSFRRVPDAQVDLVLMNAEADFSRFSRLMIDDMGIYFPTESTTSEEDIARVRQAFRDAFIPRLEKYEIVEKAAPDVLQVTASLVDLRGTPMGYLPQLSRQINEILRPGHLTFIIEMKDSKSGKVQIRAADTEQSIEIDVPDDGSGASREVVEAAEYWATLVGDFLDQNLAHIDG